MHGDNRYDSETERLWRKIGELEKEIARLTRLEGGHTWGDVLGTYLMTPGVAFILPASNRVWAVSSSGFFNWVDISRALTINGSNPYAVGLDGMVPFVDISGAGQGFLLSGSNVQARANLAWTLSTWIRFQAGAIGVEKPIVNKWIDGVTQCYRLYKNDDDEIVFEISSDGTNEFAVTGSVPVVADHWYQLTGMFDPGEALHLYQNVPGEKDLVHDEETTSIPAGLFDSSAASPGLYFGTDAFFSARTEADVATFEGYWYVLTEALVKRRFTVARRLFGV